MAAPFTFSFNTCLMSIYFMLGHVLSLGNTVMACIAKVLIFMGPTFYCAKGGISPQKSKLIMR